MLTSPSASNSSEAEPSPGNGSNSPDSEEVIISDANGGVSSGSNAEKREIDESPENVTPVKSSISAINATIAPASVKERYLRLVAISIGTLVCLTVWFSATAILPQLIAYWSLDTAESSLLTVMVQIGFSTGAVTLSVFSVPDRVQARVLFLIGGIAAAVANVLLAAWPNFPFAVIMRFLTGFSIALVYPPGMRILSTWFLADRGLAIGILICAFCIGSGAPHLLNGFQASSNWPLIIYITSGLSLGGGILGFFVGIDGPFKLNKAMFQLKTIGKLYKDPGFLFPVLGYYCHMWESYSSWSWFAKFYDYVLSLSDPTDPVGNQAKASFVTFAFIAIGGIGAAIGGRVADKWGRPKTIILCNVITALCSFTIGFLTFTPIGAGIVAMIWGFWIPPDSGLYSTMITEMLADRSLVGTALAVQTGTGFLLSVISIFLIPVLAPYLTWTWLFAILTPGPVLAVCCMIKVLRNQRAASK